MGSAAVSASKLEEISIDRDSGVALYQQVEEALRKAVMDGSLPAGERLPAIQELAVRLQVSRNTVRRAFQALAAAGHLEGTAQSGFRVRAAPAQPAQSDRKAFDRATALEQIDSARLRASGPVRPFRPGFPDAKEFPLATWEALRAQALRENAAKLLGEAAGFGYFPLREAIANRLRGSRGVTCTAGQVIITLGTQQALHLAVQTLVSPGDAVGLEEPGSYAAKALFQHAGARVLPLLVDEEGLVVPEGRRQSPPAVIYATPANQFPLSAKLSAGRRTALLEFVHGVGAWIIEADEDGEFSYSRQPALSLQGADDHERVLYLGGLEKMLFPALAIGYLVVPEALLEKFAKTAELLGALPSLIDQATLERFIRGGHLDEHLRRMNALYYRRLQALAEAVDSELDEFIDLEPAEAGLHAVGWLKRGVDEQVVANAATSAGIELPLLSHFGRTALLRPGVVFGFAGFSEKQIRRAVRRLRRALQSKKAGSGIPRTSLLTRLLHRR